MSEIELWTAIKNKLINDQTINQEIYQTYLARARFIASAEGSEFFLVIRSTFGVRLIEPIVGQISSLIKELTNKTVVLKAISLEKYRQQENIIKQKKIYLSDNKTHYEYSFKRFITGPSNLQAYKACRAVTQNPGKWNPLFIYGPSGLGKTHLLKAIAHEFVNRYLNLKVLFISSDDFARQVVNALQRGHVEIEDFKTEINSNDILLIDDVQFLAKKDKTNEILFTIFNHFLENGKQLIFSSDKLPDQLNGFDARLITRFNLGLSIPIQTLDFTTAREITEIELENQALKNKVTPEVLIYIAQYFANDVRKIKGSITKINFWMLTTETQEPLTLPMMQELFKDMTIINTGEINVKRIKEVVADKYGVTVKLIDGKSRISQATSARHLAMYLTKELLGHSLVQIGGEFGGRDHTTVMSGIKKIKNYIDLENEFGKQVEIIKNKILS